MGSEDRAPGDEVTVVVGASPDGEQGTPVRRPLRWLAPLAGLALVALLAGLLGDDAAPAPTTASPRTLPPPEAELSPIEALAGDWERTELAGGALLELVAGGGEGFLAVGRDWTRDLADFWWSDDGRRWRWLGATGGLRPLALAIDPSDPREAVVAGRMGRESVLVRVNRGGVSSPEPLGEIEVQAVGYDGEGVVVAGSERRRPVVLRRELAAEPVEHDPEQVGAIHGLDPAGGVAVGEVEGAPAVWARSAAGVWERLPVSVRNPPERGFREVATLPGGGAVATGAGHVFWSADLRSWTMVMPEVVRAMGDVAGGVLLVTKPAGGPYQLQLVEAAGQQPTPLGDLAEPDGFVAGLAGVGGRVVATGWTSGRQAAVWAPDVSGVVEGSGSEPGWETVVRLPTGGQAIFESARVPAGVLVWTPNRYRLVTPDGTSEPVMLELRSGGYLVGRAVLDDTVVVPGHDGRLWVSEDGGRGWTSTGLPGFRVEAVTVTDGEFVGFGRSEEGPVTGRSADGRNWHVAGVETEWRPEGVEAVPGGFVGVDGRTGDRVASRDGLDWVQGAAVPELVDWARLQADLPTKLELAAAGLAPGESPLDLEPRLWGVDGRVWGDGTGFWTIDRGQLVRFSPLPEIRVPLDVGSGLLTAQLHPVPWEGRARVVGVRNGEVAIWEWSG